MMTSNEQRLNEDHNRDELSEKNLENNRKELSKIERDVCQQYHMNLN